MKEEKVCIKLLDENALLPTYGSIDAAGADLYANITERETIKPHETKLIKTGGTWGYAYDGLTFKDIYTKGGVPPQGTKWWGAQAKEVQSFIMELIKKESG